MNSLQRNAVTFMALLLPLLHGCSDRDDNPIEPDIVEPSEEIGAAPPPAQPMPEPTAPEPMTTPEPETPPLEATADINAVGDSGVSGQIEFVQSGELLELSGEISGLAAGEHGFHVHEGTSCDTPGEHFAPYGMNHGDPAAEEHHLGDLGNVTANAEGVANLSMSTQQLALDGTHPISGRVLVVHAERDDLTTQPSGNSGDAVACGVIAMAGGQTPAVGTRDTGGKDEEQEPAS